MVKKESQSFGRLSDMREANLYTLSLKDFQVKISDYGASVVSICIKNPDTQKYTDLVLGFDTASDYEKDQSCFGGVCGRFANRIKNARFRLNGQNYKLAANNNTNHLHGGLEGFHKKLWKAEFIKDGLSLVYTSPDNEEGYPGELKLRVTYTLSIENTLTIKYRGFSDKDTIVNLTNHTYFNLCGHKSKDISNHFLKLNCLEYTSIDSTGCPDGKILPVIGTPLDFINYHKISERINSSHEQILKANGYDHNFVIQKPHSQGSLMDLPLAASVSSPHLEFQKSLVMKVYTDKPGIQLYTGNYIKKNTRGKSGAIYGQRQGFCLETQHFPDSINHNNFPSPILRAKQEYNFTSIYSFSYV